MARGSGVVMPRSEAFSAAATFPRLSGDPDRTTTPEELLAASHAVCFGIGLRSVLAQRGGRASKVRVTATITAEKGSGAIRIRSSHLEAYVEGLEAVHVDGLPEIAQATKEACAISAVLRESVAITVNVHAV